MNALCIANHVVWAPVLEAGIGAEQDGVDQNAGIVRVQVKCAR